MYFFLTKLSAMKKISLFFAAALLVVNTALAMDVSVSYATFKSPEQKFIELYLHFAGSTITFQPINDSTFQAQMEVVVLFKQQEEIVKIDKFLLSSPTSKYAIDFVDLKRYALDNGEYQLIVAVSDKGDEKNQKEFQTKIKIDYNNQSLQQSDIQLLASYKKATTEGAFTKNGFNLEPLPYNFYGRNASALIFYNEIYNADQAVGDVFSISYAIEKLVNNKAHTVAIAHKRLDPTPVIPLLLQMDISQLESGNYNLVLMVRNRAKELLSKKTIFFQRSNPYLNVENLSASDVNLEEEFVKKLSAQQLKYSLRAITSLMDQRDVEVVNLMLKNDSLNAQRLYLFNYWTNQSPTNPEYAYQKFMEVAAAVDKQFKSGFRYGFETDRGYIFMKYGKPDDMERRENEPSAPPYEVWSYNDFPKTNQTNVKFLFYNPSLAPGDFVLLHSTARGEMNNPQWERELYRDAPNDIDGDYFGGSGVQDNMNRHARRVFRDY